jgi:hypothetical protein
MGTGGLGPAWAANPNGVDLFQPEQRGGCTQGAAQRTVRADPGGEGHLIGKVGGVEAVHLDAMGAQPLLHRIGVLVAGAAQYDDHGRGFLARLDLDVVRWGG